MPLAPNMSGPSSAHPGSHEGSTSTGYWITSQTVAMVASDKTQGRGSAPAVIRSAGRYLVGTVSSELRSQLARAIQEARRVAEAGARQSLAGMAVDHHEPHGSMSPDARALRNRLRAHGRQLGDRRDRATGRQEIDRLTHEVAYEHWHRMLFARFLAENQLLIEPESGVAISMAECEELAREQREDPWALAGRYAERMLPRIFRSDDPALAVELAPEARQALERLLEALPAGVFTADDSLGWTYQFWQADRKDAVNASGVKIGADELPAVTQLFTEHYMVQFLLHNTIGAWRAARILAERPELRETAADEDELRRAVRLEAHCGYDFDYLRFVRDPRDGDEEGKPTGPWRPAAGCFEDWPRTAAELRVFDPCCGSGHFLVEGFELLVRLRMEEETLPVEDAIRAVLADNLFGLELDDRCTQIAAFNLALAAWKLAGRPIDLPPLQIACSGIATGASKKEWLELAGSDSRLRAGMEWLYELFQKAPELGSLIDPRAGGRDIRQMDFDVMQPLLATALEREADDAERQERAVAAQGMARAAELLARTYTLVITNVPYLGRGNQTNTLRRFADEHYKEAKADLSTLFVARIFRWLGRNGTQAVVTPQNWLFLTGYKNLREKLLRLRKWNVVARLGPGAFETIGGHVVNVALGVLSADKPKPSWQIGGLDASSGQAPREKADLLRGEHIVGPDESQYGTVRVVLQAAQLANPDSRIVGEVLAEGRPLREIATALSGCSAGDSPRFVRSFWEVPCSSCDWEFHQSTVSNTCEFGGRTEAIFWQAQRGEMYKLALSVRHLNHAAQNWLRGKPNWGKNGVVISQMGNLPATLYTGERYDCNCCAIVPNDQRHLPALWAFCASPDFSREVRKLNQKINVTPGTLLDVPFDLDYWHEQLAGRQSVPQPTASDPQTWLFHGHPAKTEPQTALQVAVARLLGYRWPPEHDPDMRLDKAARAWVKRCHELEKLTDEDGIVCLSATRGEATAADRLRQLLAAAFGGDWSATKERELLAAAAGDRTPADSLGEWLRDRFFEEHCKLFHHRPFVWHIWDGRKDGFHALVNYHSLAGPDGEGRRTLEALTYSYLGDWIARQLAEQREGLEGADARLAAAQDLQAQLEKILAGEPPCDLFVRWKPLHRQAIGWEPDIDDGVRLNIRPFMAVDLRKGGRKGAGILRWKPNNIKWKKDRGKEPQSLRPKQDFPWFWSCGGDGSLGDCEDFMGGPEFDGNRWNDLHYTNATKHAARERAGEDQAT